MNKHTPGPWEDEVFARFRTKKCWRRWRIEALHCNLRYGGPAPEDLQSLSDALEEACDIARDAIELAVNGAQP